MKVERKHLSLIPPLTCPIPSSIRGKHHQLDNLDQDLRQTEPEKPIKTRHAELPSMWFIQIVMYARNLSPENNPDSTQVQQRKRKKSCAGIKSTGIYRNEHQLEPLTAMPRKAFETQPLALYQPTALYLVTRTWDLAKEALLFRGEARPLG